MWHYELPVATLVGNTLKTQFHVSRLIEYVVRWNRGSGCLAQVGGHLAP